MTLVTSVGVLLRTALSSYSSLSDLVENGTATRPSFCRPPTPQPRPLRVPGVLEPPQDPPQLHHHNQQILR